MDGIHFTLPSLVVRGSNYEVGWQEGWTFRHRIQHFLKANRAMQTRHLPFYETARGKEVYENCLETVNNHFPQYLAEIKGIAEGVDVPFEQIFLLNIQPEFELMMRDELGGKGAMDGAGCTTLHLRINGQVYLAHNEDVPPDLANSGILLSAEILPDELNGFSHERFTAYAYAGLLPGNTFGFNRHGLCHSGNLCHTKGVVVKGRTPKQIFLRHMLRAKTLDDFLDMAVSVPALSHGYIYNLTEMTPCQPYMTPSNGTINGTANGIANQRSAKIEILGTPTGNLIHEHRIADDMFHRVVNIFDHIKQEQYRCISSERRRQRIDEMISTKPPKSIDDLKKILGDQKDWEYPILRRINFENNDLSTAMTSVFDSTSSTMTLFRYYPDKTEPMAVYEVGGKTATLAM